MPTWLIVALAVAGVVLALLALCMVPDGGDGGCAVRLAAAAVVLFGVAVVLAGCR